MWDIVCQLNVYLRTYKTASPRGGELASLVATASNSSLVCATFGFLHQTGPCPRCCRSGRQRFYAHCPANSQLVSRNRWWSVALRDLLLLARRCTTILVAPTPSQRSRRRRKRFGYNGPAWSRSSRLRPLSLSGCSRVTLLDVISAGPGGRRISGGRFVQPMLHTSICTYTPGRSRLTSYVPA